MYPREIMHARRLLPLMLPGLIAMGAAGLGVACGPEPIPIPDPEPFGELASQVHFGMMVADLREIRPNVYIAKDGTYVEEFMTHDLAYLFSPKAEDRPPPPTARLLAVESHREYWDTLRLWPEWEPGSYLLATPIGLRGARSSAMPGSP